MENLIKDRRTFPKRGGKYVPPMTPEEVALKKKLQNIYDERERQSRENAEYMEYEAYLRGSRFQKKQ